MARYYGSLQGNKGEASRMGTPSSGINAHIRGWNVGVKVQIQPDPDDDTKDIVYVWKTGGSNSACVDSDDVTWREVG